MNLSLSYVHRAHWQKTAPTVPASRGRTGQPLLSPSPGPGVGVGSAVDRGGGRRVGLTARLLPGQLHVQRAHVPLVRCAKKRNVGCATLTRQRRRGRVPGAGIASDLRSADDGTYQGSLPVAT